MEKFIKSIKPDTTPFDTFRDRVIKECNVSRQTWYNWSKGLPVEATYKSIINRIALDMFGKAVFNEES